jgi:hypothetical protein
MFWRVENIGVHQDCIGRPKGSVAVYAALLVNKDITSTSTNSNVADIARTAVRLNKTYNFLINFLFSYTEFTDRGCH